MDAVDRLRERAQNEQTVLALNAFCKQIEAELAKEREKVALYRKSRLLVVDDLAAEREKVKELAKDLSRVLETVKYLRGIAERGSGDRCPEDMTVEKFVLGYVKNLEQHIRNQNEQLAAAQATIAEMREAGVKVVGRNLTEGMALVAARLFDKANGRKITAERLWQVLFDAAVPLVLPTSLDALHEARAREVSRCAKLAEDHGHFAFAALLKAEAEKIRGKQ